MSWFEMTELLGNLGEFVGSIAVVVTLIILVVQVRQNALAVEESNKLQRVATIDRHSDTIGEWRTQVASNPALAEVWMKARADAPLEDIEMLQLNFIFINLVNTQRANYTRANAVGEKGLARQAVFAVASEVVLSDIMQKEWDMVAEWTRVASPEFIEDIEVVLNEKKAGAHAQYSVGGLPLESETQTD